MGLVAPLNYLPELEKDFLVRARLAFKYDM
jgi:hypothetical protein